MSEAVPVAVSFPISLISSSGVAAAVEVSRPPAIDQSRDADL
jgi:hypothetical protein